MDVVMAHLHIGGNHVDEAVASYPAAIAVFPEFQGR